MIPRLHDTLRQNLRTAIVGRLTERAAFSEALTAGRLPFHVVHVYGPGGVGKTTLLREFECLALEAGVPTALLDMRDAGSDPGSFQHAVSAAFEQASGSDIAGPDVAGRSVLLLDTFEAAQGLDGWLQRVFLPSQSAELLVVIAGRHAPTSSWTADAAWASAIARMPLGNLSDADAVAFLDRHRVPAEVRADVLSFTRGYPLALALAAERFQQHSDTAFALAEVPDVARTLAERFVRDVPSAAHRTAIEGTALVRTVTEPLLSDLLASETCGDSAPVDAPADAAALFEWLRGLTFVEDGPRGLVLNEVAREAIETDLRWRDAERHAALHARARAHYTSRLRTSGAGTAVVLGDYVHLLRDNPVVRPLLGQLRDARCRNVRPPRPMRPSDTEALVAMVRRHEGDAQAEIAARWFAVQPGSTEVLDDADGTPAGFLTSLALDQAAPRDRDADPLAAVAWAAAGRTRRPDERVLLFRFWMDADVHQSVSAVQSLIFAQAVRHCLTTPRLAISLFPVSEPDVWTPALSFAGLVRWPETEASGDGQAVHVFGMDWRAVPPAVWLEMLAARLPHVVPDAPTRVPAQALAVLSREAFAEAVLDALRDVARPYKLVENPLLRTALIAAAAGPDADHALRVAALVSRLSEAAETLQASPRGVPCWNALRLTYFMPAPSQAIASERLDVPFSSFRRHLTRGVVHVTEELWRQELAA